MPSARDVVIDYEDTDYRYETQKFFRDLPYFIKEYIIALLPIATWIHRYNLQVHLLTITRLNIYIYIYICISFSLLFFPWVLEQE